jgi:hypothetical protein
MDRSSFYFPFNGGWFLRLTGPMYFVFCRLYPSFLPATTAVFSSCLSSLYNCITGAGLPIHMIKEVSWEPKRKKTSVGLLVYYSIICRLLTKHTEETSSTVALFTVTLPPHHTLPPGFKSLFTQRRFFGLSCIEHVLVNSAPQIPLYRMMLGLNPVPKLIDPVFVKISPKPYDIAKCYRMRRIR